MSNYDRRFELLIDGVPFIEPRAGRQFSMLFEITHDFGGFNSYADFTIRNLSEKSVSQRFRKGSSIEFRAGYVDNIDQIFSGTIKNITRNRPEIGSTGTRIICVGGNLSDSRGRVAKTFGAGVKVPDIIRALAEALGRSAVIADSDFSDVKPYSGGYTMNGDPVVYLDRLASAHKFRYIIEGPELVIVRDGVTRRAAPLVVSQFTGMEDMPEITEVGANVSMRLNPSAKIGAPFRIESRLARFEFSNLYFQDVPESAGQGEYKILRVTHSGDSTGDRWTTKLVGIS